MEEAPPQGQGFFQVGQRQAGRFPSAGLDDQ
jgi:hypothetical protein